MEVTVAPFLMQVDPADPARLITMSECGSTPQPASILRRIREEEFSPGSYPGDRGRAFPTSATNINRV